MSGTSRGFSEEDRVDSAIAQWTSMRLLTAGLQVRVLLAEHKKAPEEIPGLSAFWNTPYAMQSWHP